VSLLAAAFVPAAPLIHPAAASGAAEESAGLRARGIDAVTTALGTPGVEQVVAIGPAPRASDGSALIRYPSGARGSLRGIGVDVELGRGDGATVLPTALGLGAWFLDLAGYAGPVTCVGIAEDASPDEVTAAADAIDVSPPTALLVVGDGTACRTDKAPGAFDERAEAIDAEIVRALAACDLEAFAALDATTCTELKVSGRTAWQAAVALVARERRTWSGEVLAQEAPYGVGYVVASWRAVA
jgi:hypothetical protein